VQSSAPSSKTGAPPKEGKPDVKPHGGLRHLPRSLRGRGRLAWLLGMEGPEYLAWIKEDTEHEHTALFGATTYWLMSGFASEMPDDPGLVALTAMPKVVFSSTLKAPLSWANTELVDGDPVETVQDLKRRGSRLLRTVGSLSLCRSLLAAGVVDRFRGVVFPVITGAHREGPHLRRVSRHRPRLGRKPRLRRWAPGARVRSHCARRTAWRQRLMTITAIRALH
jgi:dihydrofolate reductase